MKREKSFETLQQLDIIQNKQYTELASIIEDLIEEIQLQVSDSFSSQNNDNSIENRQEKLQQQIEQVVKRVDNQCQNYAKYTLDYLFQLNSNSNSTQYNSNNNIPLKNYLISIKAFLKKPSNKMVCDKLKSQIKADLSKLNQSKNSIQYYDEVKKQDKQINNSNTKGGQKRKEQEEGFISSDSDYTVSDQSEKNNNLKGKQMNLQEGRNQVSVDNSEELKFDDDEESVFKLKTKIKEQEQLILELKEKVVNRECILSEITYGYMKDVSHWKEIFNRKDKDFQNCFEVSYFEPSIIYDDKIREILNSRLQDLKIQCENKIFQMQKKFKKLQDEYEKLQGTLYAFMSQNDPFSVAKTLFAMENNPHKIWRILQDQVGNTYFFRVFESQRPGYGIRLKKNIKLFYQIEYTQCNRYKEIDELIASSKASSREYEEFKKHMKFQMDKLVERSQQEIEFIRKEAGEKEKEIEQIRQGFSIDLEKVRQETIKNMEEQFVVREQKQYEEFEERRKDIYEQFGNRNFEKIIEDSQLKVVFQKWLFAAKLMKIKAILDEQSDQTIEEKQNFLKKFILRQISKPTQIQIPKLSKQNDTQGSLFNSKRFGKLSKRQSVVSQQSRLRNQSSVSENNQEGLDKQATLTDIFSQKRDSIQSQKAEIKNEKKQSDIQEDNKLSITEGVFRKVEEIDDSIISEEKDNNQQSKKQFIEEADIDQIFELEKEIDFLNNQVKEQQAQQSGLEEKLSFLNKQVGRLSQELQQQRDFNQQIKHQNRELQLKINLYQDTFSEIAKKIGFHDLKIEDIGDSSNRKAKNFMKQIENSNQQEQGGFKLALETQQTNNQAADAMLGEEFKEKGTCTKIYEQEQKDIEDLLVAENLDQQNVEINQRETVRVSGNVILIDKDTQTDLDMKDIDFKIKKKLKRNVTTHGQSSSSSKKDKALFDKFNIDELEKNASTYLNKQNPHGSHLIDSPQYMRAKYNGQNPIQDEIEDSSDEEKKNYNKRNSVWDRLFNDQFDRRRREEELKKQLESIEEQHWQEILKILNLYSQKQFDTENEIIKPFLPKYVPRKKQQQQQMTQNDQRRCYTPNEVNKQRANSSNKETILNQQNTCSFLQAERTPPSQTQSTIRPKSRADHYYKKIQTEPSQIDLNSNHIYLQSSTGKDKFGNDLSQIKTDSAQDINNIKTTPFEYFADIYVKQTKKQNPELQLKQQLQFVQKFSNLDKLLNPIFPPNSNPTTSANKQITRNRSHSMNRQKLISMSDKKEQLPSAAAGMNQNKSFNQNQFSQQTATTPFIQTQSTFYYSKYSQMYGKKGNVNNNSTKQNFFPNS